MSKTIDQELFVPVKKGQATTFRFEDDFVEEDVRCVPMIVRFKLDACGIKLKLTEWSKFETDERISLMEMPCGTREETKAYHSFLYKLIKVKTGQNATLLPLQQNLIWSNAENIPTELEVKAKEFSCNIKLRDWKSLNNLQRFALIKLCRPGHENKNLPKAMIEFGLMK
jgi:hypothetical protein